MTEFDHPEVTLKIQIYFLGGLQVANCLSGGLEVGRGLLGGLGGGKG